MIADTFCMSLAIGLFASSVLIVSFFNAKRVHEKHNREGQ